MTLTTSTPSHTPHANFTHKIASAAAASPAQREDQLLQIFRELTDIVKETLGHDPEMASMVASRLLRGMQERWGGGQGPKVFPAPDKFERDAAIRAEFNGTNAEALCKRHGIARSTLYRIAGSQRA